jgi:hypothetical protein
MCGNLKKEKKKGNPKNIFVTLVIPNLTQESETWTLTTNDTNRLESIETFFNIPKWPPGARTANGTALCHYVQLHRHFVSQSSEFCRHNPMCRFSTSVYFCEHIFIYRLSLETFGYTLVQYEWKTPKDYRTSSMDHLDSPEGDSASRKIFLIYSTRQNRYRMTKNMMERTTATAMGMTQTNELIS